MPKQHDGMKLQLEGGIGGPAWRVALNPAEIETATKILCDRAGLSYRDEHVLLQHLCQIVSAEIQRLASE